MGEAGISETGKVDGKSAWSVDLFCHLTIQPWCCQIVTSRDKVNLDFCLKYSNFKKCWKVTLLPPLYTHHQHIDQTKLICVACQFSKSGLENHHWDIYQNNVNLR